MGSNTQGYEANGNMTTQAGRTLSYDAENSLTNYSGEEVSAFFDYDSNGCWVKRTVNVVLSYLLSDHLGSTTVTVDSARAAD